MPPRRRKRTSPGENRPYKIMLPQDISDRIDQKAKATGLPLSRVIINDLAAIPYLETVGKFAELVSAMEVLLLRQGARLTSIDTSEQLVAAVDAVLAADGGTLQAAVDKLRLARNGMLAIERNKAKMKQAGQIVE